MRPLGVVFWRSEQGNEPVCEWLKNLPADVTKAIGDDLRLVQWQWPVGKPLVDGFGDGLYEVRTKYKNVNHRVLFTFENEAIILLHGIIKKTPKTPQAVIALARQRQKE
jgi:phage-related protein